MKNWTLRFRAIDKENFDELMSGIKTIETRAATTKYQPIEVGDTLTFTCEDERFMKTITKKYIWPSIDEMLGEVPMQSVMPSVNSVKEMKEEYSSYSGYNEKIREFGLLGFEVK